MTSRVNGAWEYDFLLEKNYQLAFSTTRPIKPVQQLFASVVLYNEKKEKCTGVYYPSNIADINFIFGHF